MFFETEIGIDKYEQKLLDISKRIENNNNIQGVALKISAFL